MGHPSVDVETQCAPRSLIDAYRQSHVIAIRFSALSRAGLPSEFPTQCSYNV